MPSSAAERRRTSPERLSRICAWIAERSAVSRTRSRSSRTVCEPSSSDPPIAAGTVKAKTPSVVALGSSAYAASMPASVASATNGVAGAER